jgi:hypothetical protein
MMNKSWKFYLFGALFLGAMVPSNIALAQYPGSGAYYWRKPRQTQPRLYGPNGSDPAPQFRQSSPSSNSQHSVEYVRELANALSNKLNDHPNREGMLMNVCNGNTDPYLRSQGFSPVNMLVFKKELGC